jgi:1-acyl-sn-glycerol-3-phosphate acyltransferase
MTSLCQFLLFWIFHLLFRFLLRAKTNVPDGIVIEKDKPLIIAVNHPSRIDPFLIGLLPWRVVKKLIPMYFLTANRYYRHWWLRIFIKPLGAYPLREKAWTLEEFLGSTLEKLNNGQKIMIFPEGQLTGAFNADNAKPGIIYLAMKSGAQILPVHLQGLFGASFWDVVLRRRQVTLSIGEPFLFSKKISNNEEAVRASGEIMRAIYAL